MKMFDFPAEQTCPGCKESFCSAPLKEEYDPVVVITCPHCETMLWRPGLDEASPLYPFDPSEDPDAF